MANRRNAAYRHDSPNAYCVSCGIRKTVGQPSPGEGNWPAKLHISEPMMDVLLQAAAEFRDLCDEEGEYDHAVDFIDWVRPDAVSEGFASPITLSAERTMDRQK